MAWSGGNYTKGNNATGGWTGDASLGIGIEAGRHDTQDDDFATGINQCLNKDGSNAATGNLNLGGFKYTNAAAATARTELARVDQVQDGDFIWLGTTGGTATAQTASATPAITAYKAGQKFRAIIGAGLSSTGQTPTAHTININSIGAKIIENGDGLSASSPTIGTWVAGNIIELVYTGTNFKLMNDPGSWLTWTPTLNAPVGSIASTTIIMARYRKIGHVVTMHVNFTTTATGVGAQIEITNPPIALANAPTIYTIQYGHMVVAGAATTGYVYNNSATNIAVTKDAVGTNIGTGAVQSRFTFIYESV